MSRAAEPSAATTTGYRIDDRYRLDTGRVFLSGAQALARLPLEQLRIDRRNGWNTAAYVTGYPGSPLASFDGDLTVAAALAEADGYRYVFQPGLNEELAATAVMGSQLSSGLRSAQHDGVIGFWYGKGPGLDRASDALRHAVMAGTAARGGAVALVGEDPSAKSSTLPTSSDVTLVDLRIPVLCPGDVQEAIDLGRHAIAMSRASGAWSAIRIVEVVADGTGTVDLHPDRIVPVIPTIEMNGRAFVPHATGSLLTPRTLELERELHDTRFELVRRYGVENRLNRVVLRGPNDWIGIAATGHTFHEVREALATLGLRTDADLYAAGVRLAQLSMPWPLDAAAVREFADGLAEVVVVEDKNQTIELGVTAALYPLAQRPVVVGRRSPDGAVLMPSTGSLAADTIAAPLRTRLLQRIAPERLASPGEHAAAAAATRQRIPLSVNRTPYFCSGCPHNTSTQAPEGTLVGAGIGCHTMVALMEPGRYGEIVGVTAMGNEGAQWFGMAPFVADTHLVQNIGDGTLFHSGLLAVRAAVANGANITYKVLYNGAVAMTGGQDPFGQLDVPQLAQVFLSEGVRRVIVTTDDLARYRSGARAAALPTGVDVWDRSRVVEAQEVLARVPGTTVLIHDQRCAAEKRRDRKRGRIAAPGFRVLINERVCEGCGDCGQKSNCLSVQPVDTPFGRKTRIDQGSCNLDTTCVEGDCPSFTTVKPGRDKRRPARVAPTAIALADLPDPVVVAPTDRCTVRLSGIGGTGVVTVSQILGTAAMLDGFAVRGLDQTGLSQKAGPVVSDVRLSRGEPQASNRATLGSVDTLLAFDLLVAASDTHLGAASAARTRVAASTSTVGTGSMVVHPDTPYPVRDALARLGAASTQMVMADAIAASTALFGDPATANVYLLGFATQHGLVPVSTVRIEEAITLNNVAVDANIVAFRAGRAAAVAAGDRGPSATAVAVAETLPQLIERLADDLTGYQSPRTAQRYREVLARAATVDAPSFTEAVAVYLHKVMAYKDEYEVARLLLAPEARAAAEAVGGPGAKVAWNLHPPMFRSLGMQRKIRLGRWATPLLMGLRAGRRLRGTPLDVFGWPSLRRMERAMRDEYIAAVDTLVAGLGTSPEAATLSEAVAIASLPERVRGYEHLKRERAEAYRTELAARLAAFSR